MAEEENPAFDQGLETPEDIKIETEYVEEAGGSVTLLTCLRSGAVAAWKHVGLEPTPDQLQKAYRAVKDYRKDVLEREQV